MQETYLHRQSTIPYSTLKNTYKVTSKNHLASNEKSLLQDKKALLSNLKPISNDLRKRIHNISSKSISGITTQEKQNSEYLPNSLRFNHQSNTPSTLHYSTSIQNFSLSNHREKNYNYSETSSESSTISQATGQQMKIYNKTKQNNTTNMNSMNSMNISSIVNSAKLTSKKTYNPITGATTTYYPLHKSKLLPNTNALDTKQEYKISNRRVSGDIGVISNVLRPITHGPQSDIQKENPLLQKQNSNFPTNILLDQREVKASRRSENVSPKKRLQFSNRNLIEEYMLEDARFEENLSSSSQSLKLLLRRLQRVQDENISLKTENSNLKHQVNEVQSLRFENQRLLMQMNQLEEEITNLTLSHSVPSKSNPSTIRSRYSINSETPISRYSSLSDIHSISDVKSRQSLSSEGISRKSSISEIQGSESPDSEEFNPSKYMLRHVLLQRGDPTYKGTNKR